MKLITDRTSQDVERWKELRDKGWSKMSASERQEWLGESTSSPSAAKGMYTHNDLNRVESAVEMVVNQLREAGYNPPDLVTKTNWTYRDTIGKSDMERYFKNISYLRKCATTYPTTPNVPSVGISMDYKKANDIEKILEDIHSIATNVMQSWYYAGEIVSGEV